MLGKLIIASATLLCLQGCTATHIFMAQEPVRGGSAEPAKADSIGPVEKTTTFECPSNTVVEVRVKRSPYDALVTLLSLGIYQSTRLDYVCGKASDVVPTLGARSGGHG